jgi:hypothetical protein
LTFHPTTREMPPTPRPIRSWGTATAQVDVRITTELNGETGVMLPAAGKPISVLFLGIEDGRVRVIHLVANPSKLDGVVHTPR